MIDTPGLLDRNMDERNDIEKQAVLALKYLTNVMIFILDPSESCGYPMEKQIALLSSVEKGFIGIPIMTVESKSDLFRSSSDNLKFSADTGENMDVLTGTLKDMLRTVVP